MSALSRRRLRDIDIDESLPATDLPDPRAQDIAALVHVDEGVMAALQRVFADTALLENPDKVRAILQARGQVAEAWADARNAFLEIGRALLVVDHSLNQPERDALKRGFGQLFPFSETVASQFRQIARAVDDGRLPLEACPGSYGTAYQLALLTPEQMAIAKQRGLVRPDVPRNAVIAFRKQMQETAPPREIDFGKLRAELRRLEGEWRRQIDTLRGMRQRIQRIRALLSKQPPDLDGAGKGQDRAAGHGADAA